MSELTKRQEKGVDLIVKSLSKKFPFIKGWEESKDNERFQVTFFIDLLIDFFEMADFYGKEIKPEWVRRYKLDGPKDIYSSSLGSMILKGDDEPMFEGPTFSEMYDNSREIKRYADSMYNMLPDDFKILQNEKDIFGDPKYKEIGVNNYIQHQ